MKLVVLAFIFVLVIYCVVSKVIFDNVYETSNCVIDEFFHLPQGLEYCQLNFSSWNPKITTLPGLYILSTIFLSPFKACSVYWLRFVSLGASIANFILIFLLLRVSGKHDNWKNLFLATNLALLPPLYFFGHLYYTDVASVTFVLLTLYLYKTGNIIGATISGFFSILLRQTNVIFVGMTFLHYIVKELYAILNKKNAPNDLKYNETKMLFKKLKCFKMHDVSLSTWCNLISFLAVFLSFCVFVVLNGGIAVGDKTAHVATVHGVQIFYFSLFCLFFTWPYFITLIPSFLKYVLRRRKLCILILIVSCIIVHYSTLVHPYLLADNRHYTFYIWKRFYQKYSLFEYLMVPVYFFSLYCFFVSLRFYDDFSFVATYVLCVVPLLIMQKMIEVRYFLLPYIIFRLYLRKVTYWQLCIEFLHYLLINILTFYVFFTKDIYWSDFSYPQKLIW